MVADADGATANVGTAGVCACAIGFAEGGTNRAGEATTGGSGNSSFGKGRDITPLGKGIPDCIVVPETKSKMISLLLFLSPTINATCWGAIDATRMPLRITSPSA